MKQHYETKQKFGATNSLKPKVRSQRAQCELSTHCPTLCSRVIPQSCSDSGPTQKDIGWWTSCQRMQESSNRNTTWGKTKARAMWWNKVNNNPSSFWHQMLPETPFPTLRKIDLNILTTFGLYLYVRQLFYKSPPHVTPFQPRLRILIEQNYDSVFFFWVIKMLYPWCKKDRKWGS